MSLGIIAQWLNRNFEVGGNTVSEEGLALGYTRRRLANRIATLRSSLAIALKEHQSVKLTWHSALRTCVAVIVVTVATLLIENTAISEEMVLTLWPEGTPNAVGNEPADIPTLTVFKPESDKNTGVAIVVCPGGGYGGLAAHENQPIAQWLASRGITAFVLKYRLGPRYHHPAMIQDANRAIRTVRAKSDQFGVNPAKIGILGFSAGGHLASTAGTHYVKGTAEAKDPIERASSRPDFMILAYPVIAMATEYGHAGSRRNLLGDQPSEELVKSLSNETQVTPDTPPAFIIQTDEDKVVPAENSILFVLALRKSGVPCEFHMFEKGRHGLGLGMGDPAFSEWPKLCEIWLKQRKILTE
ncbi:MAG: hypothetical protein RJA81_1783 [Planctomycetota bacterium]